MPPVPQTLNGISAISVRVLIPWTGVWVADVELDLALLPVSAAPSSGPAILVVGGAVLKGTIDPAASSTFSSSAWCRVIGGGGGWGKSVSPQHFNLPAGVLLSTAVYNATALLVGEAVLDPLPILYGTDFVRTGGPASRVFGDRDWHLDLTTGIATVLPWLPSIFDPTAATITEWNGIEQRAHIASDALILPGTILIDPRFGATTYTVREVEHVFDRSGATATVWCRDKSGSRLASSLKNLVTEWSNRKYVQTYLYRFVLPVGSKLALQAITPGAPDLNPLAQWTGLAGASSKFLPGTVVVVGFAGGDPANPYLVSFSPLATALEIDLAGGANFLVPAPWAVALAAALAVFAGAASLSVTDPVLSAAATALQSALASLPLPSTILVKAT